MIISDETKKMDQFSLWPDFDFNLIATSLKLRVGIVIRQSLGYAYWKFHTPTHSDMGMTIVSIIYSWKPAILYLTMVSKLPFI